MVPALRAPRLRDYSGRHYNRRRPWLRIVAAVGARTAAASLLRTTVRTTVSNRGAPGTRMPPPTPERYRKALEQWHSLPDSVRRPPIDLTEEQEPEPPKPEGDGEPAGRSTK